MNRCLLVVACLVVGACTENQAGPDAGTKPETKVGFIYVGPRGDYGWTKSHEDGRLFLDQYGENVKSKYLENVPPDQTNAKIDELYGEGYKIIFTTSFDYLEYALKAPEKKTDLWMMNCSGFKTAKHVGNYQARVEQAEYLTGMVAGAMTKTNKIGMVGALRIYEQMAHMNAFALGVRAVNPKAEILVRWVGNWFSPAMEAQAVKDLVTLGGVDVIKGKTDTNIPIVEGDKLKTPAGDPVWTIGHDNKDYCNNAKNGSCLVSSFYNWGPYYKKVVEEIAAGSYPENGRMDYLGAREMDIIGISSISDKVPAQVITNVQTKQSEITQGKFNVFQGPFNYDDGTEWKKAGETLSDEEITCTKRFVAGLKNFDGPACAKNEDCGTDGKLTCDTARSLCVAPDLSGCGK